jgi:glycerol-3-phosphate dehydrogenase
MALETPLTKESIIAERCGVRALVVGENQSGVSDDWHKLSRKHVLEVDREKLILSIFGGKLTDCINVGQEVIGQFKKMGFQLDKPKKWFGEGVGAVSKDFEARVEGRSLDKASAERIAKGLWRRHGLAAQVILDASGEPLEEAFEGTGITYAEIIYVIQTEMVVTSEDLLRRRLPLAMLRSAAELASNSKMQEILRREKLT